MIETKMNSLKLDEVMEDIGVTEEVIHFRRYVHLLRETMISILQKEYSQANVRIFGSQSEGSTTFGMESDTDILFYLNNMIACIDSYCGDAPLVFLIIKTAMSLPQCCSLQFVKMDNNNKINPVTVENMHDFFKAYIDDQCVLDQQSRVLYSNQCFLLKTLSSFCEELGLHKVEQHGPAIKIIETETDSVSAIYCSSLPDECRVLFTKLNQPGHWPKPETKLKANTCEMYLVTPGNLSHTFSYDPVRSAAIMHVRYARDFLNSQWQMSTNMIERLLMFDLNIFQMKTYIITKMIKKELLVPIVGDRLSTFHMKTALFFTVETFPEHIWTKDNLVQCVLYCLITLRRFLKRRVCPHYTVSSVNLFNYKLQLYDYPKLIDALSVIINSQLKCIETMRMDNIGERLLVSVRAISSPSKFRLSCRNEHVSLIITRLLIVFLDRLMSALLELSLDTQMAETNLHLCAANIETSLQHGCEYFEELVFVLQYIYSTLASMKASKSIAMERPINEDILKMYKLSLSPMHTLNYLKYASMLVCTQQYTRAEALLQHIEGLISSDMIHVSIDRSDILIQEEQINSTGMSSAKDILMRNVSKMLIEVDFTTVEISCVPSHLVFEMYRTVTEEECSIRELNKDFKNCKISINNVAVEAIPFLHYLQYMSSQDVEAKQIALNKLIAYCIAKLSVVRNEGHIETTLNMIGHIWELEKNIADAWTIYKISVELVPWNNPSYWHLFRLFGSLIYG